MNENEELRSEVSRLKIENEQNRVLIRSYTTEIRRLNESIEDQTAFLNSKPISKLSQKSDDVKFLQLEVDELHLQAELTKLLGHRKELPVSEE